MIPKYLLFAFINCAFISIISQAPVPNGENVLFYCSKVIKATQDLQKMIETYNSMIESYGQMSKNERQSSRSPVESLSDATAMKLTANDDQENSAKLNPSNDATSDQIDSAKNSNESVQGRAISGGNGLFNSILNTKILGSLSSSNRPTSGLNSSDTDQSLPQVENKKPIADSFKSFKQAEIANSEMQASDKSIVSAIEEKKNLSSAIPPAALTTTTPKPPATTTLSPEEIEEMKIFEEFFGSRSNPSTMRLMLDSIKQKLGMGVKKIIPPEQFREKLQAGLANQELIPAIQSSVPQVSNPQLLANPTVPAIQPVAASPPLVTFQPVTSPLVPAIQPVAASPPLVAFQPVTSPLVPAIQPVAASPPLVAFQPVASPLVPAFQPVVSPPIDVKSSSQQIIPTSPPALSAADYSKKPSNPKYVSYEEVQRQLDLEAIKLKIENTYMDSLNKPIEHAQANKEYAPLVEATALKYPTKQKLDYVEYEIPKNRMENLRLGEKNPFSRVSALTNYNNVVSEINNGIRSQPPLRYKSAFSS